MTSVADMRPVRRAGGKLRSGNAAPEPVKQPGSDGAKLPRAVHPVVPAIVIPTVNRIGEITLDVCEVGGRVVLCISQLIPIDPAESATLIELVKAANTKAKAYRSRNPGPRPGVIGAG